MKKIEFTTKSLIDGSDIIGPKATNDSYMLLSYFMGDQFNWTEVILDLESIISGEKTFDEINDPETDWSFGNSSGYFEIDGNTAYFEPYKDKTNSPRVIISLTELIELLKEWKSFLERE